MKVQESIRPASTAASSPQRTSHLRAANTSSIDVWLEGIGSSDPGNGVAALQHAYQTTRPRSAEFIVAAGCGFACKHCIYPPTFSRFNSALNADQWRQILLDCVNELGMKTFVHGGRSLDRTGLKVLENLRADAPETRIGLIDNGISFRPFQSALRDLGLDWIDVSLDGASREHDLQRGKAGSFEQALDGALWLLENDAAPRVNILTCLTSINATSIPGMIRPD